jgi:hypothetical protein
MARTLKARRHSILDFDIQNEIVRSRPGLPGPPGRKTRDGAPSPILNREGWLDDGSMSIYTPLARLG